MASAGGIRAGKAYVELYADSSRLERGLKAASASLKRWGDSIASIGKGMMGLGVGITAPLTAAAALAAESGAALWDMSRRTGMSVEALSGLGFVADMTGTNLDTLEGGLRRMQKTIAGVADEAEGTTGSLDHIGLAAQAIVGQAPDEQFRQIATAILAIKDPTERSAAAMKIFGRSGTMLIPMMEEFNRLSKMAAGMGFIKSGKEAKEAKDFSENLMLVGKSTKAVAVAFGSAVMPILKAFNEKLIRGSLMVRDFVKSHGELVRTLFTVGSVLTIAGAALIGFGLLVKGVGLGLAAIATVAHLVTGAIALIGTVLAAVLSPMGAIIIMTGIFVGFVLKSTGVLDAALSWLGEKFGNLKDDALAAFQGISNALAAGDIGLAAKVLWATLKLEWQRGIQALQEIWQPVKLWFSTLFADAAFGALKLWNDFCYGISIAWIEVTDFLKKWWITFVAGWKTVTNELSGWLAKRLLEIQGLFDDSLDVEAAKKFVDQDTQREQDKIAGEKNQALTQAENTHVSQESKAQQEHAQQNAAIHEGYQAEVARLKADHDKSLADAQAEVNRAKAEWQASLNKAADAKKKAEGKGPPEAPQLPQFDPNAAVEAIQKIETRGTFNVMGAFGMASGGVEVQMLDNLKKISKNTERWLGMPFFA